MKKGNKLFVTSLMLAMGLLGCGKPDVSEDFEKINGDTTAEESTDATSEQEGNLTVDIMGKQVEVVYDTSEIDMGINEVISTKAYEVDDEFFENLAKNIFDFGEYEANEINEDGGIYISYQSEDFANDYVSVSGKIDGIKYELAYSKTIKGFGAGHEFMDIIRLGEDGLPISFGYRPVPEEENTGNRCDKNAAMAQADSLMDRLGFTDYELVTSAGIKVWDINQNTFEEEATGYMFAYAKKIDGRIPTNYPDYNFYRDNGEFPTATEQVTISITDDGLMEISFNMPYELEKGYEQKIISVDKAIASANENLQDAIDSNWLINLYESMLATGFDGQNQYEVTSPFESKIVIKVELSYIPLRGSECVEYTPVYVFSLVIEDTEEESVLCAVSAIDGASISCGYRYEFAK